MKGGENMNISKVYYEELKSKCINGKWESVRIGAMVDVGKDDVAKIALEYAKEFVKENLIEEIGANEKQKELLKALEEIIKEAKKII